MQTNRKIERNRMEKDLPSHYEPKEGWVVMLMSVKVEFISTRSKKEDFITIKEDFIIIKASNSPER